MPRLKWIIRRASKSKRNRCTEKKNKKRLRRKRKKQSKLKSWIYKLWRLSKEHKGSNLRKANRRKCKL